MFVKPPGPRHTFTDGTDGLVIRIPARRNIFIFGFLSFWLCGWAAGEIGVTTVLITHAFRQQPQDAAFMLIWLSAWTVGGAFAILIWLWQFKGCEAITVTPAALGIKRELLGYGPNRRYDVSEIRDLRVAPISFNPYDFRSATAFWGIGGGALAFDYGYKTYRFGAGVEEAEAKIILKEILSRLPQSQSGI